MYVSYLLVHMYVHYVHSWYLRVLEKGILYSLNLELQRIVSYHVGSGN